MSSTPTNSLNNQDVLVHVCRILELDDQAVAFLENNRIKSVRRFNTTTVDRYQELANLPNSPINTTEIDQINLFQIWYTNLIQNKGQPSNQDLIDVLTKKE